MSIILRNPFKYNSIERNPLTYGLREEIIKQCIVELYNDNNLLISGTRGIGKSSLAVQLQKVLNGDGTLLAKCGIEIEFPAYITLSHTCFSSDHLEQIINILIEDLEIKINNNKSHFKVNSAKLEINILNTFKASIDATQTMDYNTLAYNFVNAINKTSEIFVNPHINIVLDELHQLNENINISHFIKVISEMLDRNDYTGLSFILVGQDGIYNRLIQQQPAFERLIKFINLEPLDIENSEYVLDACLREATHETDIQKKPKDLLLCISSGYPYSIHLLGHESFNCMIDRYDNLPINGLHMSFGVMLDMFPDPLI